MPKLKTNAKPDREATKKKCIEKCGACVYQ